jgi:hypothetical protein
VNESDDVEKRVVEERGKFVCCWKLGTLKVGDVD